ncbi:MAG: hypothetical protein JWN40_4031 [Phycisphaerales bacterium]|jgi:hypothetical protein|nr:hypothetical protein [Phycisphaerales bacterium]
MNAIRIRKKIDSETIHIPELRPMIGQEVEIIVLEDRPLSLDGIDPQAFWNGKTVDELAKEQGVGPLTTLESPVSSQFTAEDFEGFDETLEEWRNEKN